MSVPESTPQQYPEPAAPLRAQHLGVETVLVLDADEALVASTSEPDVWHVVTGGRCSCPGFRYRESCRHLAVAAAAHATLATAGVKAGDWPTGWGGPAVIDQAELDAPPPGEDGGAGADTELARIFGRWQ